MQTPKLSGQEGYGLSPNLWANFPIQNILAGDRGTGIGFFDDFMTFSPTTLVGGYTILATTGCTVAQIVSEANAFGQVKLTIDGNAANDEAVLCRGGGLDAPYKLADKDLVFECRIKATLITAAKWSWFVGLSEAAAGTTDHLFADAGSSVCAMADYNHFGFSKLTAEGGAVDCAFKADGQTYQDGATKTKLDTIHTMVAATYVKLGFRFDALGKRIRYFVNGEEKPSATLTAATIDAATFPDDVFLTPVIGIKDAVGDTAMTGLTIDWWACAQLV